MTHLDQERKLASFDSRKLADLFYTFNGENRLQSFTDFQKVLAEDPILRFDPSELGHGRKELIDIYAKKAARIHELFGLSSPTVLDNNHVIPHQMLGSVHSIMFIPTIVNLGTEEQVSKWLADAASCKVFGCYAQTELGHGSDVQSLETTATYDPATEEFVIHSPTVSSIKFWPGELGLNANHAVTHAQLIINGKRYGVQTFVIQIRDMETHLPLPGIQVGDIGSKLGYLTKDNGYLRFDHVRIPRFNMLAKYAKVDKDGTFTKQGNDKIGYATMMFVRLKLIEGSFSNLSMTSTIATRYAVFRKQFKDENGVERKIMDYQLHANKLLPILATTFAMNAGYKKIIRLYYEMMRNIKERDDFSTMNELHSVLSGCKSFYTWDTHNGIEVCRQACGGHGFSDFSGIPLVFESYSPNVTLEGDNTVMALQTARYILKAGQKALSGGKLLGSVEYLKNIKEIVSVQRCSAKGKEDFGSLEILDKALQANAAQLLWKAMMKFSKLMRAGASMKEVWDKKAGIDLFEASRAHIFYFTFKSFMQMIQDEVKDEGIANVLRKLCLLYGIQKLLDYPLGVAESGYFLPTHFSYLKEKREDLLEELRPEIVALTDAFAYRDESLHSALAVSDGKVYETLYDWASNKNYLNTGKPHDGYMKHLKPVLGKYSHLKPKL